MTRPNRKHLRNPKASRHQRIFELLRHSDPAIQPAEDEQPVVPRPLSGAEVEGLKQVALNSLTGSDSAAPKPRRYHKLF